MSNVEKWSLVDSENGTDAAPDGAPEGHLRTDVNDITREGMRAVRQQWETMAWFDKTKGPSGLGYNVAKNGNSQVDLTHQTTPTDIRSKFKVGARIRIGDGSTYVHGFVSSLAYAPPITTVTMDMDGSDVVQTTPTTVELHSTDGEVGRAAFSPIGTTLSQDPPEIPSIDDLGDGALLDQGDGEGFDADTVDGQHAADILATAAASAGVGLINGNFEIGQRGHILTDTTSYPTDNDAYVADGWILLQGDLTAHPSPGSGVVDIGLIDSGAINGKADPKCIGIEGNLNVGPAENEKVGLIQWLPADACQHLDGAVVSLSVWVQLPGATNFDNARIGIIAWTGAADAMPTDPILDWKGASVTPTLLANFTLFETASFLAAVDWSEHKLENVTLPAGTKNVAVMLWADDTNWSSGDSINFTAVSLVEGALASPYVHEDHSLNLRRCQRFFNSTFEEGDLVAQKSGEQVSALRTITNSSSSGTLLWDFGTSMYKSPIINTYNPNSGGSDGEEPWNVTLGVDAAVTFTSSSKRRVHFDLTGGPDDNVILHATADASI